jgi:hypothetical protein
MNPMVEDVVAPAAGQHHGDCQDNRGTGHGQALHKAQAADSVGMAGHKSQIYGGQLPEESPESEDPPNPYCQQASEDGARNERVPPTGKAKFRLPAWAASYEPA